MSCSSAVLIEANGTSDAAELHDILALDPRLAAMSRPMQVTVVDARRWQKRWFDKALERDQVTTASHIWLNWVEGLDQRRLNSVESSLAEANPKAQRITPDALTSELAALLNSGDTARILQASNRAASHYHEPARHHFASAGVALPAVVDREQLTAMVLAMGPALRRAKGVVGLSDTPDQQWAWSFVGGDDALRFEALPGGGFTTVAVFIGVDLPEDELSQQLARLQQASA
jgi:G3E family GTPase